ncbi:MAG: AAA family ATPase [Lentimicrobiaceae bacterium]|jgi:predicted AAA+ superfamily ATPase|nr:AAA family ATPase [Lentimicrobiaceae bacterium]
MISRILTESISSRLGSGKAIIVMGPRQVGKTTMLRTLFPDTEYVLFLNGDEMDVRRLFENMTSTRLRAIIGNKRVVVIDEAQRIEDIGLSRPKKSLQVNN